MRKRSACVGVACAAGLAASASGATLPLAVVENFDGASLAGLSLWVDIESNLAGTIDFRFRNNSDPLSVNAAASITGIYFEQTSLLSGGSISAFTNPGVSFLKDSPNPKNPGGGLGPTWNAFASFSANPPPSQSGVGSGQFLTLRFDLNGTVSQVLSAIDNGDFRIAQHVQSVGSGGDASIWTIVVIPLPGTAGLGALGLGLVAIRRRR